MRRILIDYKKLDHKTAAALIDAYPYGYGDEDLILLKKPSGEIIEAVEVRTEDTVYLVKISNSLFNFIANFEENIERELSDEHSEKMVNSIDGPSLESHDFEADSDLEEENSF